MSVEKIVRETVLKNISEKLEIGEVELDQNLFEMGLSSMGFIKSMVALESFYDIELEELLPEECSTLRKIISMVNTALESRDDNA
ncbi:acyl carrier protein [Paenibacillus sp. GbtcB18]|uniref:acyl carrier protein n=1 Tax=Paenibacillus sp. GbtcB18 TaxID=2824763 RepID=UPI001C30614D|nr:acyl carrier protein [Paenibacillus sp. GbtcB18]